MRKCLLAILIAALGFGSVQAEKISFGGYGELHYNQPNVAGQEVNRQLDFHRLVLGWEIPFKHGALLNAEIDFEHAAKEPELEFAYIEKVMGEGLSFRVGSLLMPVGPLNEFHEPPHFPSVERPQFQTLFVPTTWQEGGAGVLYERSNWRVRGYLVGGLDGSKFRKSDGIRKGRGGVGEQPASDLGVVVRGEVSPLLGLDLGGSFYDAGASQAQVGLEGVRVQLYELDAKVLFRGFLFQGAFGQTQVRHADKIQAVTCASKSGCSNPGSKIAGWFTQLAYRWSLGEGRRLEPFVQYEFVDTHHGVPFNVAQDPTQRRHFTTLGLAYFPEPDLAYKLDVQLTNFGGGKSRETQWNAGFAFEY